MKFNRKNPLWQTDPQKAREGLAKELREVFDHIELIEKQHGGKTIRNSAKYDLIKEILGE